MTLLAFFGIGITSLAQQYRLITVAGAGPPLSSLPPLNVAVGGVIGTATDRLGNVYFSTSLNLIFKLALDGTLLRVAGTGEPGFSGDGKPATAARLNFPQGLAIDSSDNLYIVDSSNCRVRKIDINGIITTVAGRGDCSFSGDNGPAISAGLNYPGAIAADSDGNLYIGEIGRIRKVTPRHSIVTLATGVSPAGIAVDSSGNVYAGSVDGVFRIASDGVQTKIAGNGHFGYGGDGQPALNAPLGLVLGLALDSAGNVIMADGSVRKISPDGIIRTIAPPTCCMASNGSYVSGLSGGVAVDQSGNIYVAAFLRSTLQKVTAAGLVTTAAGTASPTYVGDGGRALNAQLWSPQGLTVDTSGNVYIADFSDSRIRKVSARGVITTVAGNGVSGFSGDGGPATSAAIGGPVGVAVDRAGNIFFSEYLNNRVRKIAPDGTITTVVGNGLCCQLGDGGPATDAEIGLPHGIAVDSAGNLYIADFLNSRIRKVTPDGIITTIAGNGVRGSAGDGGPAVNAELDLPAAVAVGASGNVYIEDSGAIRRISPDGIIRSVQGPVRAAGLASDPLGNVFIGGQEIWKISPDGEVSASAVQVPGHTEASWPVSAVSSSGEIFFIQGNQVQALIPERLPRPRF